MAAASQRSARTRDPSAPFLWTAPLAVAAGGASLLRFGERALLDSWSPVTMGLTHFATLGFVSMILIAAFYRMAPDVLERPMRGGRLSLFVYVAFSVGVASLGVGLEGGSIPAVFVAIGGIFPALAAFFWPAITSLRGTHGRPDARPLRLAIGAFLIVSIIGIWVAHGHGGMKFPGPRPLWIEMHLSIALFGWVGSMTTAAFGASTRREGECDPGLPRAWSPLVLAGIALSTAVLAVDYAGGLRLAASTSKWIGAAAALPAAIASALLAPWWGLRRLRETRPAIPARALWKTSFVLAPVVLVLALDALVSRAPEVRLVFGWVAIWGWGGCMTHAIWLGLRGPAPRALATSILHGVSLALGVAAIVSHAPSLAHATGVSLLLLAIAQLAHLFSNRRAQE